MQGKNNRFTNNKIACIAGTDCTIWKNKSNLVLYMDGLLTCDTSTVPVAVYVMGEQSVATQHSQNGIMGENTMTL